MKNDPYLKFIFASIVLGLILALFSTHVHANAPLEPVHVTAPAPHWRHALQAKASQLARPPVPLAPSVEAVNTPAPAMPAPTAADLHLGS